MSGSYFIDEAGLTPPFQFVVVRQFIFPQLVAFLGMLRLLKLERRFGCHCVEAGWRGHPVRAGLSLAGGPSANLSNFERGLKSGSHIGCLQTFSV